MTAAGFRVDRDKLRARLIGALAALIIATVTAVGAAAVAAFDRAVEPELINRTRLIGVMVRNEIQRALDFNIPLDSIVGLDRYLSETLKKFDEVDRISVITASSQTIGFVERAGAPPVSGQRNFGEAIAVRQASFVLPILDGNVLIGEITVDISPVFVQTRLRDVFLDVLVIGLVATLVALELALLVTAASVGKPLDRVLRLLGEQREGNFSHRIRPGGLGGLGRMAERLNDHAEDLAERLAAIPSAVRARICATRETQIADGRPVRLRLSDISDIRFALFLFSIATEIASAFLPLYARDAARPEWLSPQVAAATPLMAYLAVIAVLSPFAGALVRRFGARRLFLASIPPTVLALVALGHSSNVAEVIFWRGLTAIFYATSTIACQEYAIHAATYRGSTHSFGTFIVVVYSGVFCGSALGGVLAGRFGYESAFMAGAVIAAFSGIIGSIAMKGRAGDPHARPVPLGFGPSQSRKLGFRFVALLLGMAVPMNAATAIFIWYLTPLILAASGSSLSEIARVTMLYYLCAILFNHTVVRIADGRMGPVPLLICGALMSGAALLSLTIFSGFWAIAAAVVGLGLGHASIRAPLYALTLKTTAGSGAGIGALRLIERLGALLGLAASALFLTHLGAEKSLLALGTAVLVGAGLYAISEVFERFTRKKME